jgi:hypothetical protein
VPERNHEEILRLRDRVHSLDNWRQIADWRLRKLESWRSEAEQTIDALANEELIGKAVDVKLAEKRRDERERVEEARTLYLSRTQKLVALGVALLAIAGSIRGLVS